MTTTDSHRILRILGDLDRFLVAVLDPILKDAGIGREHWQVLRLLQDGRGRPMGAVRASLGLPGATATRVVDVLVTDMLVYRRSDPLDRRRVLVHLAEPGWGVLHRIEGALQDHVAPLLVSFDPRERRVMVSLLEKLAGVVTEAPSPAVVEQVRQE